MATDRAIMVPSKGKVLCLKCGGNGTHENMRRDANGWPIGFICWTTCSHCEGEGELIKPVDKPEPPAMPTSAPSVPWNAPLEPGPVKVEGWGAPAPVDKVGEGWGIFDASKNS